MELRISVVVFPILKTYSKVKVKQGQFQSFGRDNYNLKHVALSEI